MSIRSKAIMAIIGPSGCGKSTFIRCLNRMHEVSHGGRTEGCIMLDGKDIYARDADPVVIRRRIGMVFQKPAPFPTMTVFDNVAAGPEIDTILEPALGIGRSRRTQSATGGPLGRSKR